METNTHTELPKLDIPVDWIVGKDISREILSMYTNFPCRLKACIFALCMSGEIEASIDAATYRVKAGDFVTILPGSILQILAVKGELDIYFIGYSSGFISSPDILKQTLDIFHAIKTSPVFSLKTEVADIFRDHMNLLCKTYLTFYGKISREMVKRMLFTFICGLEELYRNRQTTQTLRMKGEQIAGEFTQLVMQHYSHERGVAFYADKMGITPAHLSTTVRQATGKTCLDIIASMVIMDAKAQLKSTDASIKDIAYSLNFTNMSFFGKYFKRYVGISPLEYRNS